MNFVTYISSIHDLSLAREYGIKEVLIAEKKFARLGKIDFLNANLLAIAAKDLGLKTVLIWDTLATEFDFRKQKAYFESLNLENFDCVRAQDPGVIHYLASRNIRTQLSLETGNHNLTGIKKWIASFQHVLDKVILSIELPEHKIAEYCEKLAVPVEILGVGPILLFYTPRMLLGAQLENKDSAARSDEFLHVLAESEESPHKGFPVIENRHGTFMFHIKNFFILEHFQKLFTQGLHSTRLDLTDNKMEFLANFYEFIQGNITLAELKSAYGQETIRGFYHINKSDVLFKKLKNHRIQRRDDSYIGEVVDVVKGRFIILQIKSNSLSAKDIIQYTTPEGKELDSTIEKLMDLDQIEIQRANLGETVLVNYRNGVLTKSQIYLK